MDPFTMMALMGGVSAGVGALQGQQKEKQQKQFNDSQAEITRYSPWTGMRGQVTPTTDNALGGAMQGGLGGALFGQRIASMQGAAKPEVTTGGNGYTSAYDLPQGTDNGMNAHLSSGQFGGGAMDSGAASQQMGHEPSSMNLYSGMRNRSFGLS